MSYHSRTTCRNCSGHAQPGTVALMKYLILRFPETGSLGIYNCRNVAGSSSLSQHSCGRAGDSRIPTLAGGAANTALGYPVVQFLDRYSTELGIVEQIYDRVLYDAKTPRGRYYGGVHPHRDHVHWTQTPAKATGLTFEAIVAIAGSPTTGEDDMLGFSIGRVGTPALPFMERSAALQLMLNDRGARLTVDGVAGDGTRQALIAYQTAKGIAAPERGSGEIGAYTYAALYAPVPGPPGKAGADGEDGAPGKAGTNGRDGADGAPGKAGKDGKVVSVVVNGDTIAVE